MAFIGLINCCDKNVIVACSLTIKTDQNASERISGKRLKNQVEYRIFITHRNTLGDLQNRRVAGNPVTDGFDPHSLPPFFNGLQRVTIHSQSVECSPATFGVCCAGLTSFRRSTGEK